MLPLDIRNFRKGNVFRHILSVCSQRGGDPYMTTNALWDISHGHLESPLLTTRVSIPIT